MNYLKCKNEYKNATHLFFKWFGTYASNDSSPIDFLKYYIEDVVDDFYIGMPEYNAYITDKEIVDLIKKSNPKLFTSFQGCDSIKVNMNSIEGMLECIEIMYQNNKI
ncbi:MAG: hypothetical protein ACOC2U_01905 [bacterium]